MVKPLLVHDLAEATYHADTDTLSASGAKVLLGKRPPTALDALLLGTIVHTVALEPHRLDRYVTLDAHEIAGNNPKTGKPYDAPHMTAKYKAAAAEAEASGSIVVSADTWKQAHAMAEAIRKHPVAKELLDTATGFEVSAYADHPTGARVRGRFDLVGHGWIGDIKTTRDADPLTFGKTTHSLGYHISAANYIDLANACGLDVHRFLMICVEKELTPGGEYRVAVHELTSTAIEVGRADMATACKRWLALGKRVDLPGYGDDIHVIDIPEYAYPELDLEITA